MTTDGILLKNLSRNAYGALCSRFGAQTWVPGEWVEHDSPLVLCRSGLHANPGATLAGAFRRASHYVYPLGGVWRVEIDGEVLRDGDKICARRMRLVERVDRARAFNAAWPAGDGARLEIVDDVIEMARAVDWSACYGGRDARDVVRAFRPWRAAAYAADAAYDAVDAAYAAYAAYGAAGRAARYGYAQAIAPRDPHVQHANPFVPLLLHYAEGGSWQDVSDAWSSR